MATNDDLQLKNHFAAEVKYSVRGDYSSDYEIADDVTDRFDFEGFDAGF